MYPKLWEASGVPYAGAARPARGARPRAPRRARSPAHRLRRLVTAILQRRKRAPGAPLRALQPARVPRSGGDRLGQTDGASRHPRRPRRQACAVDVGIHQPVARFGRPCARSGLGVTGLALLVLTLVAADARTALGEVTTPSAVSGPGDAEYRKALDLVYDGDFLTAEARLSALAAEQPGRPRGPVPAGARPRVAARAGPAEPRPRRRGPGPRRPRARARRRRARPPPRGRPRAPRPRGGPRGEEPPPPLPLGEGRGLARGDADARGAPRRALRRGRGGATSTSVSASTTTTPRRCPASSSCCAS